MKALTILRISTAIAGSIARALVDQSALAQQATASGDLRNTTVTGVPTNIQYVAAYQLTRDGQAIGTGGLAVAPDGKLSFSDKHGGFWQVKEGIVAKVSFRDAEGRMFALVGLTNMLFWNADGVVTQGLTNMLSFTTRQNEKDVTEAIAKRKQTKDGVEVTTDKGRRYLLSGFRYDFEGTVKKLSDK